VARTLRDQCPLVDDTGYIAWLNKFWHVPHGSKHPFMPMNCPFEAIID